MMATTSAAGVAGAGADPATRIKLADLAERLVWTFVAAFTSALVSPPLAQAAGVHLTLTALDAAVLAGSTAVINLMTLVARWRLDVLPDPGTALRTR